MKLITLLRRLNPGYLVLLFVGVALPLLVFGKIAREVWEKEGFAFDLPPLQAIHRYSSPALDKAMVAITNAGFPMFTVPLAVIVLAVLTAKRRWLDASFLTLAVLGASAIDVLAKNFFGRPRPQLWVSPAPEFDSGFPSGHSMFSMAVMSALIVLLWGTKWRYPVLVAGTLFVLLVGVSRIYLGVHYPSDVLAAWTGALAWVLGLSAIVYAKSFRVFRPEGDAKPSVEMQRG